MHRTNPPNHSFKTMGKPHVSMTTSARTREQLSGTTPTIAQLGICTQAGFGFVHKFCFLAAFQATAPKLPVLFCPGCWQAGCTPRYATKVTWYVNMVTCTCCLHWLLCACDTHCICWWVVCLLLLLALLPYTLLHQMVKSAMICSYVRGSHG